jgi:threonylcarbamoyladenosine tRNA methylthiotransferase MtaB
MEFVKDIQFSRIHVFKYSVREGTKAAEMTEQVDDMIKSQRSKELIDLGDSISNEFMKKFIGKKISVLIENEKDDKLYEGYTTNYLKVLLKSDINVKNEIINVHIDKIRNDYLLSE